MKIFLIRHGESEANSKETHQGQRIDSSLSDKGKCQAEKLAIRLKDNKIDAIYSSDLKRAKETAEAINKFHNLEIRFDKRLREFDIGDFTYEKNPWFLFNDLKKEGEKKGIEKTMIKFPNGESENDHYVRVKEFLLEIQSRPEKNILIVAHGGTNKILLSLANLSSRDEMYNIRQGNCCLNEIDWVDNKWKTHRINCLAHLNPDSEAIKVFNRVRDEPLDVVSNRCWEKSKKLKTELEKLGYKVKFGICSFNWSSQRFPPNILAHPHNDIGYHLFLLVKIHGDYLNIDPSNDSLLPSFNEWDGLTNCELSVIPSVIFSKDKDNKIEEKEKIENDNFQNYPEFYFAINRFFEELRK